MARRRTSRPTIAIRVEAGAWPPPRRLRALAERAVGAAITHGLGVPADADLSLLFTDDAHMRGLNATWRKSDKTTNVLSFPADASGSPGFGPFLGDLALAFETIDRESAALGLTFEDHLTHLILHGFLHLLGFDHAKDGEADRMEGLETAILGGLGIKDPYRAPGA